MQKCLLLVNSSIWTWISFMSIAFLSDNNKFQWNYTSSSSSNNNSNNNNRLNLQVTVVGDGCYFCTHLVKRIQWTLLYKLAWQVCRWAFWNLQNNKSNLNYKLTKVTSRGNNSPFEIWLGMSIRSQEVKPTSGDMRYSGKSLGKSWMLLKFLLNSS